MCGSYNALRFLFCCLCFENYIHSTVELFAEYCTLSVLFVVWCGVCNVFLSQI